MSLSPPTPLLVYIQGRATDPNQHVVVAVTTPAFAARLLGSDSTSGALPAQTPEYLEPRAKQMWGELQALLSNTPGEPGVMFV
jgi:phage terminase small subunit